MKHTFKWMLAIIILLLPQLMFAQGRVVTGKVVDATGETVIGASVLEIGTKNGTTTDLDGNFKLKVTSANPALKISFVGYMEQSIIIGNRSSIKVVMKDNTKELGEVVVVGYGQQKKESVVGAIGQLTSKELLKSPVGNLSQALAGKIPGVITTQSSGAPGFDDTKIYIRGRASFAGDNQPLILVDGVERPFSQIAPDDIASISVLKDASATAVYGVRGANGVMLITTKRGSDQKPIVSLSANWQVQSPTRSDSYLDSYNSVVLLEEALANDGLPSQYSAHDIEMYRKSCNGELSGTDALLYPNIDWYDQVLRKSAPAERYNVNVQGGTKKMRYFVSAEYYNQDGLYKNFSTDEYKNKSNSNYKRYSFRANMDFDMVKNLTLSVNFGTRFEERHSPNTTETSTYSQVFYELNHSPGWIFPINYTIGEGDAQQILYGGSSQYQDNIIGCLAKAGFVKATNTISETNFIANYKMDWITPGLSAKAMISFDYNAYYNRKFTASFSTFELTDRTNPNSLSSYTKFNQDSQLAYAGNDQATTYKLYMEYQLNYARKFGKHDVTAMLLYDQNDYRYQAELAKRYQGLVGRVTYGFDDRYLAEANFGYNGSENFRSGKRFGFFPSFSIGWRLSNEQFMKKYSDVIDNLKIRLSFGQVGNDVYNINGVAQRFLYEPVWAQLANDYLFGSSSWKTGIYESQYPNYNVTWERANKFNLGIDFSLFKSLLSGTIDMFYEKRNNILTSYLSRPEWVGVYMAAGNLGKTKNEGYEIDLKHQNRIGKDFYYTVDLNFTHSHNEILDMDEPESKTSYRKLEGHPINQYFGLICDGFVTAADLADPNFPVSTYGTVKVGDLKYRDMNQDGFIDDRDVTYIGNSDIPENTYGLTLSGTWKGFGLSVMFQGVDHVSRYYDAEAMYAFVNGGKVKSIHLDRWNPNKSEEYNLANAKYPLLHYDSYGNHNQRENSFFLKNGAFMRLKNIEVSYTLPEKIVRTLTMSEVRFYVNANNLITWDHLDDLCDPESNGSNRYPIMKTINFGVNVKF